MLRYLKDWFVLFFFCLSCFPDSMFAFYWYINTNERPNEWDFPPPANSFYWSLPVAKIRPSACPVSNVALWHCGQGIDIEKKLKIFPAPWWKISFSPELFHLHAYMQLLWCDTGVKTYLRRIWPNEKSTRAALFASVSAPSEARIHGLSYAKHCATHIKILLHCKHRLASSAANTCGVCVHSSRCHV